MRIPLIAGNWKMHGSHAQANALVAEIIAETQSHAKIEIAILPPFVYLSSIKNLLAQSKMALGAQNLYLGAQGAFTGEVSGLMLKDVGCQYVLIGHSERRQYFNETLALTAAKYQAALDSGLTPILCIGETEQEREAQQTEAVITAQLQVVLEKVGTDGMAKGVIAYEPVWAIGTGKTATPLQAQAVHAFIRASLLDIGDTMRILYGGSMKAENAAALLAMPDIDGGLIGGASLDAKSFVAICTAAVR